MFHALSEQMSSCLRPLFMTLRERERGGEGGGQGGGGGDPSRVIAFSNWE